MLKRKSIISVVMALMLIIAYSQTPVYANENSGNNGEVVSQQESNANNGMEGDSLDYQGEDNDNSIVESPEIMAEPEDDNESPKLQKGTSSKPMASGESNSDAMTALGEDNENSGANDNIVASGECGSNLSWELNDQGVLSIRGEGNMSKWSSATSPFYTNKSSITSVIIEEGVTSIGDYAFYGCDSITRIDLPDGLTTIGSYAFDGCSALDSLDFPSSVQSFGSHVFSGCVFDTIVIPENVNTIPSKMFTDCTVDYVFIPESVETIKGATKITFFSTPSYEYGSCAFYNCKGKKIVYCESSGSKSGWEQYWTKDLGSVKYGYSLVDFYYLRQPLGAVEEEIVPEGARNIDEKFTGSKTIKRVVLPEGITKIPNNAFKGCTSLEEVVLPSTVKSIGESAFSSCGSLSSIAIPEGVTSIGKYAFGYCSSLETIAYPESYTYLCQKALYHCSNLKSIYLYNAGCDTTFTKYGGGSEVDYYPIYGWTGNLKIFMLASESSSLERLAKSLNNSNKPHVDIIPCSSKAFYEFYLSLDDSSTTIAVPSNLGEINIDAFKNFSDLESMSIDMTGNTITANNSGNSITSLKALHIKVAEGCSLNLSSNLLSRLERLWISSTEESFSEAYPEQYELIKDKAVFGVEEITDINSATFDTVTPVKYNGADNPIDFPPLIYNEKQLELGRDYELTYSIDDNEHTLNLVIAGQGTYYGTKELSIEYVQPNVTEVTVSDIPDQIYTGRRITPDVVVSLNGYTLTLGKDYSLNFDNNTNLGEATAIIELSNSFSGNRVINKSFSIIENKELDPDEIGYSLTVNAGKRTQTRHLEGQKVTINDMNEVAYQTFQKWEVVSGDYTIPASQANKRTLIITMPSSDVSLKAVYTGKSLQEDLTEENNRYNAVVYRASTLDSNIELYTNTADRIKDKYGVSSLQSSTYYANQATSTQNTITQKQNRLAALRADTAGGHQVEIKQLEAEIKELQSDYQMYLELKSAAQYQEKADAAQKERNKINLSAEETTHNNNIATICKNHGVKDQSVKEIKYIRLDKDEYAYTGKEIHPVVSVYDSAGNKLGSESYSIVYPADCTTEGEHIITFNLQGDYTGKKTKSFNIVKHKYGEWVVTKAATCINEGTKERVCSECGKKETETFSGEHAFGAWTTTNAATCNETGSRERECSVCHIKETEAIKALDHQFGAWTISTPATEMNNGLQSHKCSVCGKTETKTISVLAPTLKAVKISKPKAGKKSVTVKWKKVGKKNLKMIKKVQIQVSTTSDFSSIVKNTTIGAKKTSKKISGLKKGTKYFVRIRALNGSHCSKWSSVKQFKAK